MAPPAARRDPQSSAHVQQTLQALDSAAADTSLASITGLGIPQVRALKQEIAAIFPASNLPAFLLQGLLQLKGRTLDQDRVSGDLRVLFRETRRIGLYGTFLAAPAMIIYGYQRLLTLAGKDADSAFPDGTWQFYSEFGLREDAARHCVESLGFARAAAGLREEAAAACWVYAALHTIFCYDELLENEWHERVRLRSVDLALAEVAAAELGRKLPRKPEERDRLLAEAALGLRDRLGLTRLGAEWTERRPYHGPTASPLDGYVGARRRAFDAFLTERLAGAPAALRQRAEALYAERRAGELPTFQAQMTIQRTLRPDAFSERREPLAAETLGVALVSGGAYALIDLFERDDAGHLLITPRDGDPARPGQSLPLNRDGDGALYDRYEQPVTIDRLGHVRVSGRRIGRLRRVPPGLVHAQVAAALRANHPLQPGEPGEPSTDLLLAMAPRARQDQLRGLLGPQSRGEIEALRRAPIVISWDQHNSALALGQLRRAHRGCGDHALTIRRADPGIVFDMSHIFFDGIWGSVLAEIITGFATALIPTMSSARLVPASPAPVLRLAAPAAFRSAATEAVAQAAPEVDAETGALSLSALSGLRRRLAAREIELTINDLLLLGRYLHAATYRPGPVALASLDDLAARGPAGLDLRDRIVAWLDEQRTIVPVLLVPMDASTIDPRERLQPAALRNPCPELLPRLAACERLLRRVMKEGDAALLRQFEAERTELCGELLRFGAVLRALREITTRGEGFTTAALRLMAHLPRPLQSLLDLIPQKIEVLNEIVKGSEVFSNIGQVSRRSSLSRFMSSRDDGDTKQLIWGVMADAKGRLIVTLRDFRPHVGELLHAGHPALAELLAADFLAAYAAGTNDLVKRIQRVLAQK